MKKSLLFLAGLFFGISKLYSQTIDAFPETQTICGRGTATITVVATLGGGGGSAPTNSYAITPIPYTPDSYTAGTSCSGGYIKKQK